MPTIAELEAQARLIAKDRDGAGNYDTVVARILADALAQWPRAVEKPVPPASAQCDWCPSEARLFRAGKGCKWSACNEHRHLMPELPEDQVDPPGLQPEPPGIQDHDTQNAIQVLTSDRVRAEVAGLEAKLADVESNADFLSTRLDAMRRERDAARREREPLRTALSMLQTKLAAAERERDEERRREAEASYASVCARNVALEDAAKECERDCVEHELSGINSYRCARRIRALKTSDESKTSGGASAGHVDHAQQAASDLSPDRGPDGSGTIPARDAEPITGEGVTSAQSGRPNRECNSPGGGSTSASPPLAPGDGAGRATTSRMADGRCLRCSYLSAERVYKMCGEPDCPNEGKTCAWGHVECADPAHEPAAKNGGATPEPPADSGAGPEADLEHRLKVAAGDQERWDEPGVPFAVWLDDARITGWSCAAVAQIRCNTIRKYVNRVLVEAYASGVRGGLRIAAGECEAARDGYLEKGTPPYDSMADASGEMANHLYSLAAKVTL